MSFKFRWLCELMEALQKNRKRKATAAARTVNPDTQTVVGWFNKHNLSIARHGTSAVAFLSCLFPERRPDRVYCLQEKRLALVIGRCLGLDHSRGRVRDLNCWRERDGADFACCVESVMAQTEFDEPMPGQEVTLEEIDMALNQIAAKMALSSSDVRDRGTPCNAYEALIPIFQRLQSWEGKWLVRMILKSYRPVVVPEYTVMQQFHFLLPDLLRLQNSFEAVAEMLADTAIAQIPPRPNPAYINALKISVQQHLAPRTGVMIRRAPYDKARSLKHCCQLAGARRMSVERKYDGEYCQIHIDLFNRHGCIKIFSKSGKDSSADRLPLHRPIKDSLRIGATDCKIRTQCILEGEVLIWCDRQRAIQPFYKIRKHVLRSGRPLGAAADSPVQRTEHLMIIFYDVLLLDDALCLNESYEKRRKRLESLVRRVPGYAEVGTREIIDFSSHRAPQQLRDTFANGISRRWEGFVLKRCGEPFFSLNGASRCIKLKKDYISGLGDTADLAIVGGRRSPTIEQELGIGRLSWTYFYIGCLENKAEVVRFAAIPRFRLLDVIRPPCISKNDIIHINRLGKFRETPFSPRCPELEVKIDQSQLLRPSELFKQPFVVEVLGAGFDKPSNASYYSLRHARVIKIHADRDVSHTLNFDELQKLADLNWELSGNSDSQEDRRWIEKLTRNAGRDARLFESPLTTTPGRSPSSVETVSPTPLTGDVITSGSRIRIQAPENSPSVRQRKRLASSPIGLTSPSPRSSIPRDKKRKAASLHSTPPANTSNKRAKFSPVRPTTEASLRSSCEVPRTTVSPSWPGAAAAIRLEDPNAKIYLKSTPPWCRRSVQLPAQDFPPANSGRPLSEMTNTSADHARRQSSGEPKKTAEETRERGSPAPSPSVSAKRQRPNYQKRASPKERAVAHPAVLPTPPTSSPTEIEQKDGKTPASAVSSTIGAHPPQLHAIISSTMLKAVSDRDTELSHQTPEMQDLFTSGVFQTSPILLSRSLSNLTLDSHCALNSLLQTADLAFTYSRRHSLESICKADHAGGVNGRPRLLLVLIDAAQPDCVGREMRGMLDSLARTLEDGKLEGLGRVLFFDWKALGFQGALDGDLQEAFGGCLAWDSRRNDGTNPAAKVRTIWELRDILR